MSMNWAGCLNHNLHHNPSEKPRESPTSALTVRPRTWRGTKNTLVFTTQKTTLVHSFVEHYVAIWAATSWGVAAWGLAVAVQQSWAALWLGSGRPLLRAVKGDDNGSSIISAPPFTLGAVGRCPLLREVKGDDNGSSIISAPPWRVKGDDNGSSIISAPPFFDDSRTTLTLTHTLAHDNCNTSKS
jgi:hypothetical protein